MQKTMPSGAFRALRPIILASSSPRRRELLGSLSIPVQTGGGIRSADDVRSLLDAGAARVVVGSAAVKRTDEVAGWMKTFGADKLVLALDVRINKAGLRYVLTTDISKDGTLTGPNTALYAKLAQTFPNIDFQASGGIGSLDDIRAVSHTGAAGVIVGRALLEGKFTLEEAIECWPNE